jgi:hypothetical protein
VAPILFAADSIDTFVSILFDHVNAGFFSIVRIAAGALDVASESSIVFLERSCWLNLNPTSVGDIVAILILYTFVHKGVAAGTISAFIASRTDVNAFSCSEANDAI